METNEINNNRKVIRPASILLKDKDIYVYPGTKGILNWQFTTLGADNTVTAHPTLTKASILPQQQQTYLNFDDFSNENYHNADSFDGDAMSKFLSDNPSSTSSQEIAQPYKKETMGRQTTAGEPNNNNNSNPAYSTTTYSQNQNAGNPEGLNLSLYGWRKKCLYTIILLLMILITVNLSLTLWILKVMEFSSDGMGQLKVINGGIQLDGQALILDELRTSILRSRHGQPITFESSRNITFNTRDADGFLENQLFLGHDKLDIVAKKFKVSDLHGSVLFSVDKDAVVVGANSLRIEGEGGAVFREAIQTPLLRAEAGKDLKLESPTRSLEVRASQEVFIQSRAGSIEATSLNDIKLHSIAGSIRFDSSNLILPNLKTAQPPPLGTSSYDKSKTDHTSTHKVYQLCVCANGKLFLASSHGICAGDDTNVCR